MTNMFQDRTGKRKRFPPSWRRPENSGPVTWWWFIGRHMEDMSIWTACSGWWCVMLFTYVYHHVFVQSCRMYSIRWCAYTNTVCSIEWCWFVSDLCIYAAVSLRKMSPLNVQWKGEERSSSHRSLKSNARPLGFWKAISIDSLKVMRNKGKAESLHWMRLTSSSLICLMSGKSMTSIYMRDVVRYCYICLLLWILGGSIWFLHDISIQFYTNW